MSEKQTFEVLLEKHKTMDATSITIPFDVQQVFGARRVPVKATINGVDYRSTIFHMKGKYFMVVPKHFREAAGVRGGEMITVEMERDREPRVIEPPEDLAGALEQNPEAKSAWDKLSYSLKREHVTAVEAAKREETRRRRIEKAIEKLASAVK